MKTKMEGLKAAEDLYKNTNDIERLLITLHLLTNKNDEKTLIEESLIHCLTFCMRIFESQQKQIDKLTENILGDSK